MPSTDILFMTFTFAGGVALFLLGMKLLTDGLKLAAGDTLRTLLNRYTSTVTKGVIAGISVTALVQSSSAVIFATIGFVNAGMMTLAQAIYVIFGSNVGTTLTGWIIATIGMNINLQLMAMPMLAVGMALWLTGGNRNLGAWGQALVGFSIFFLGIDVLKNSFSDLGAIVPFDDIGTGLRGGILMVLIGIFLTTLMQSSSAAIAIVLTAAAGGVLPVSMAAYMVIGADIGTTSTAALAVYGATSNAKRSASAHVIFNIVNGVVVLFLLPFYLQAISAVFGAGITVATTIAVFHTMKKLTGLIILLPFVSRMETWLLTLFKEQEKAGATTRYLDNTVLETPVLAVSALVFELKRVGRKTRRLVADNLSHSLPAAELKSRQQPLDELHLLIGSYIQKMQRDEFPEELEDTLPQGLRVLGYFRESVEVATEIAPATNRLDSLNPALRERISSLEKMVLTLCHIADSEIPEFRLQNVNELELYFEDEYERAKSSLLNSGSRGKLSMTDMLLWHDFIRGLRRTVNQLCKAARHMDEFNRLIDHIPGEGPALLELHHSEPSNELN
jgi:phosphate:Na+ symporter